MDSETVEEIKRHFGVIAEDLRSDIRGVAEGQVLLTTRIDALEGKVDGLSQIVQLTYSEVTGRLNDHEVRLGQQAQRQP